MINSGTIFNQTYLVGARLLSFERPNNTTTYAAYDIVSSNTATSYTANELVSVFSPQNTYGYITQLQISTSDSSCTARFRIHFISVDNVLLNQDNVPFNAVDLFNYYYFGYVDMSAMSAYTGASNLGASSQNTSLRHFVQKGYSGDSLFFVIQTLDAFTPIANADINLQVKLDLIQNRL